MPRRLALLLPLFAACGEDVRDAPARRVILITCDTLRADRLGVYGYERDVSPNVDAFARDGALVYEEGYACGSMTRPSLSALLTGRLPNEVGAFPGNVSLMPPEVVTLPEILQDAGIPTSAIISNWILRAPPTRDDIDVRQGFDHYDDEMKTRELNRKTMFERLAPDTTDAAIAWLEDQDDDRFFLWVHYQDPHGPYTPPEAYAEKFDAASGPRKVRLGTSKLGLGQIPKYQVLDGEDHPDVYANRYDAEIGYFDEHFGRFIDYLREHDLYEDSLILFTSDHGESLGEHDYWFCHGENLYRESVRIPFIVRFPGGGGPDGEESNGYRRVDQVASHADFLPTTLSAFGLPERRSLGISLFDLPSTYRVVAHSLDPQPGEGRANWFAVSDGRFRLIWSDWDKKDEVQPRLYDLRDDPGETRDLSGRHPGRAENMIVTFQRALDRSRPAKPRKPTQGVPKEQTPEDAEAMKHLGYVDGNEDED